MWTLTPQPQHRGVQLRPAKSGEAPAEAVKGREAQDHDKADLDVSDGVAKSGSVYPASPIENGGDNVPRAPDKDDERDSLPLPLGK